LKIRNHSKSCSLILSSQLINRLDFLSRLTLGVSRCRKRGWVGTRRVTFRYVSSSPPLSTVHAAFTAHGATPLVHLHSIDYEASVSIATAFTDAFLCASSSFASIPSKQGTACAFAGYSVRGLLFVLLLPKG